MATCTDAKGTTVLMASYDFDKFTRLYQLPTFEPRGYLVGVSVQSPAMRRLVFPWEARHSVHHGAVEPCLATTGMVLLLLLPVPSTVLPVPAILIKLRLPATVEHCLPLSCGQPNGYVLNSC